jgi:ATP-dependent Clp protease ATP-binding subunit ClpB
VDIQLENVEKRLKDRKIRLEVSQAARGAIINEGYDPQYGARPMKRAIQRLVSDPLALRLINGDFNDGDTILVDVAPAGAELTFTRLAVNAPRFEAPQEALI